MQRRHPGCEYGVAGTCLSHGLTFCLGIAALNSREYLMRINAFNNHLLFICIIFIKI